MILFDLALFTSCGASLEGGTIDFLKLQDKINVGYDYSEFVYVWNTCIFCADEWLKGDKYIKYLVEGQSYFEDAINNTKNIGKQPIIRSGFEDAKYTLILKPTYMDFGMGTGAGAKMKTIVLLVETRNPSIILAEIATNVVNHGKGVRDRLVLGMKSAGSTFSIHSLIKLF